MPETVIRSAARVGVTGVAVALLTFAGYNTHLDFASAIPLYMLVVVLHSLTGDFRSSAVVCLMCGVCLDLFFTEPRFSLYISNPLNGLALLAFLFTALVITRLVSRVREENRSARIQKDRLDRLYQLSQQLLALPPEAAPGDRFLEPFQRLFDVNAVCIFDADMAEVHTVGLSRHGLTDKTREAYIRGQDLNDSSLHISVKCLQVGGRMAGAIGFEGLREPAETAGSLTALVTALLERTNAFRQASLAAAATQAEVYRSVVLDALAHEFKTPLATILAAAGGIREAGPLVPAQLEMAETVENEAARLGGLTSRLLRMARLDREDIQPRMELIDIASLAGHVADQYAARSADRRIFVANRQQEIEGVVDPELLRLALNQLIENGCKYSQPGSTITVQLQRQGGYIIIRVSNTGSSIPRSEQRRVFERFYRGVDAMRSTSGSGLGLYIARKIALAHGGALELEPNNAEDGVTFCLKIPITKDESEHAVTTQ